jgi:hypothetical protein
MQCDCGFFLISIQARLGDYAENGIFLDFFQNISKRSRIGVFLGCFGCPSCISPIIL